MDKMIIRKAQPDDEKWLAYIQTESWKAAFAHILPPEELARCTDLEKVEQMYHNVLSRKACTMAIGFVAEEPHCIAAWGKNRCGLKENTAELICIHSLQARWRRGYGSSMMHHILAELRLVGYESVILWVFEDHTRARCFYEKHGFVPTEQKKLTNGIMERMYRKEL